MLDTIQRGKKLGFQCLGKPMKNGRQMTEYFIRHADCPVCGFGWAVVSGWKPESSGNAGYNTITTYCGNCHARWERI